ncbi:hypothetical protein Y1Q_0013659 [Alligator mississippiensis]|uniref:Uncharacterized protein n=1 Tax=Alligator mississippiensis TaxID=8496 RepID=A0A151P3M8_ALLMI|nr:hypothetical protein Y1Q_0013659 [Alligator mississippiensis]
MAASPSLLSSCCWLLPTPNAGKSPQHANASGANDYRGERNLSGLHEAMDTPSEDAEVTTTGSGNSDHFQQTVFCSPLINGTTCEERYYSLVPVPWGEGGREEGSAPRSSRGKKE